MESTLFRYIFAHSKAQQLVLLGSTLFSFPFLYMTLDLPKTIINEAIGGADFPRSVFGYSFEQVEFLLLLCVGFICLVFVNGGFKFWINVYKGQLGERMLRRLRYQLFSRVLRFPLPHFRRISQGEIIAMITVEGEPLGGFFGDAFAGPAFQGGTLLTILVFMFVQDPILGVAAVALYPVQMYIIPKLQRRVNALGKRRVQAVRKLSERIGETVSGIQEIHSNDTSELELADFSSRVGLIFHIRYQIYRKKFFIKFLNNFLAQLTPFLFYSIGGYLVIAGDLTFGALVAILAAYKDLSGPWKELLRYYQTKEDARIKYDQLVEQFQPADMIDAALQSEEPDPLPQLHGSVIATNLVLEEEGGFKMIDGATFSFQADRRMAVIGAGGAGRSGVAKILARLLMPTAGTIRVGDHNLTALPEAVTGRRIAYVDENAFLFSGSVANNLYYGLKHRPLRAAEYDEQGQKDHDWFVDEAIASGNTASDLNAGWIDFTAAGVADMESLTQRTLEVLRTVDLEDGVYRFGLNSPLDPVARPDLAGRVLEARAVLRKRFEGDPALSKLVEPFAADRYNVNMTVAENLLFGTPIGDAFDLDNLGDNEYVLSVLEKADLTDAILDTGVKVASIMVELFQDIPADHEYFERFSFIAAEQLPEFQQIVRHVDGSGVDDLDAEDRSMLMSLPFRLIPARHRLGLIEDDIQDKLLEARKVFAEELPPGLRPSVAFFDADEYNAAASVQDNILFGRLVYGRRQAEKDVGQAIEEVVNSLNLRRALLELGLEAPVGIGGGRLTPGQRQQLAIARCLLKRPDILILDGATAAMAPSVQDFIMKGVFEEMRDRGLIWVLNQIDQARLFDHVVVMESGKVLEQGSVSDLEKPGGWLESATAAE
ncbi:MAG: ATP-binding cassette domain-containing protein [Rhodospirillales bacterium]|nr:ATP-binding cassette domain-containing protein [Rhodospirillales bacterium]